MTPSISQADSRLTHYRTATANSQKVFYREAGYSSAPALFAKDTVQSFSFRATEKVNVAASPLIEDISNADIRALISSPAVPSGQKGLYLLSWRC